jgi:hypothetical protein
MDDQTTTAPADEEPAAPAGPALPSFPDTMDECVNRFVKIRDALKEADDKHKERTAALRAYQEGLGNLMLSKLQEMGGDSLKTPHGTVYRTIKRSASIADGEAFRGYVLKAQAFDLVDWRANANAVDDFIKSHSSPPPGVNFSTMNTIGVRRK